MVDTENEISVTRAHAIHDLHVDDKWTMSECCGIFIYMYVGTRSLMYQACSSNTDFIVIKSNSSS